MLNLTKANLADYFRDQPETGMGYWIATAYLKDGSAFPQTVIVGGVVTQVRGYSAIPFTEEDIDRFQITHDKWDWS